MNSASLNQLRWAAWDGRPGGNFRPFFTPAEPPSEWLLPASLQVTTGWLKASLRTSAKDCGGLAGMPGRDRGWERAMRGEGPDRRRARGDVFVGAGRRVLGWPGVREGCFCFGRGEGP